MQVERIPQYAYQPLCFNQEKFRGNLDSVTAISVFKDAMAGMDTHLGIRFQEGEDIRTLVEERSNFTDLILHYAWHIHDWDNDIGLLAVGGYGRKELHPQSDIDILFLLNDNAKDKYNEQLQALVTFLWDIGLDIGSSVRTLSECVEIARDDVTVATNLLESRRIAGNDELKSQLQLLTSPEYMWPMEDFFAAKWKEQVERHKKHNDTECNLEPHVKNAPGGLRDLQMINWVAKRYFGVQTLRQLEGADFFTETEFGLLRQSEELLWSVRFGLHLLAGRPEERLLFEYQRELAKQFGYVDSEEGLAVEQFMHEYYRAVITLRQLNDVLLQYLHERIYDKGADSKITPINDRFQLRDNYIAVTRPTVFEETPSALLEIFVLMGNDPSISGVRASTIRLIRDNRNLIDENFREKKENRDMFLALFSINYGLVTQLNRMKHYGVLGRYLPEFGKIVGQMQHDLFHRYTVDAHTLLVIENMRRFSLPEQEKEFPIAAHIMRNLPKPELLYISGLYHDIAKGRGGDHSELGAVDAEDFCRTHGLRGKETRLVCWLVEKHLLMSYVSQKKDISDPEVIRDFALEVRDQNRLDYLYALTVADMRATNPDIWNSWRASLLSQLYTDTKRALRRGLETTVDKQELIEEKQQQALAKLADKSISAEQADTIWQNMGDEYFIRESHIDIAHQTEALLNHKSLEPLILISEWTSIMKYGATQIFIWAKDAPHIFMRTTCCLAKLGLNIQDAKIYKSSSGYTLDTFYVLDEDFETLKGATDRYDRVRSALLSALKSEDWQSNNIERLTPRQLKQFGIPTQTSISNDIVSGYTVLEVISPDRPGLLATIAEAFLEENIAVHNAKILTLGERVEDIFFITDTNGQPLSDPDLCIELQEKIKRRIDRQINQELGG